MSVYKNRVGLRNVGSYQVSGTPFVTGSSNLDDEKVHMVEFPYVSKSVTVINTTSSRLVLTQARFDVSWASKSARAASTP